MTIEVRKHIAQAVVVAPTERLDAFTAPQLREQLNQLCEEGFVYFVIDLSKVPFMDSAGVTVLVSILRRVRTLGGDIKVVRPTDPNAQRVLRLTKMDQVFRMLDRLEEPLFTF